MGLKTNALGRLLAKYREITKYGDDDVITYAVVALLLTAQQLSAGILLCLALIHAVLGVKRLRRHENWVFALTALLAAIEALTAQARFTAASVPEMVMAMKISFGFILVFATVLPWFARAYAGVRDRWIPILLTCGMATYITIMIVHPSGFLFERVWDTAPRTLPWGETIRVPVGQPNPRFLVGDLAVLAVAIYLIWIAVRLWTSGPRSRALSFTLGLGPLVLLIYPHGTLIHLGILSPPHLYSFGFLMMGLMMSRSLIDEAIQAGSLAREVEENERRWRSFRENVMLLVASCDRGGRLSYVNPFMERLMGYTAGELIGRAVDSLVIPTEADRLKAVFSEAMRTGEAPPVYETTLLAKNGAKPTVVWSNVVLRGPDRTAVGTLSIGVDVTERRAAEGERDRALAAVRELKSQLERENTYLRLELEKREGPGDIVGRSDAIQYVLHKVQQVAKTDATVLIEGETGVGKELVARALHEQSARSARPFVRVNCAALPPTLVESELFGHEKGAFTGADRERKGRFEVAERGTILLDEIGELGLDVQVKLLRVLQSGEYERVGSSQTRKCDVRVVAATNRALARESAAGRFRQDLFYRLNVFPITVPPLRDRREDIPELVMHFVRRFSAKYDKSIDQVSADLLHRLSQLEWPGNIRQLENAIERMVIASSENKLAWINDISVGPGRDSEDSDTDFVSLNEMEKTYIEKVLLKTGGRISGKGGCADILGINANTLRARMTKLGVIRPGEKMA